MKIWNKIEKEIAVRKSLEKKETIYIRED